MAAFEIALVVIILILVVAVVGLLCLLMLDPEFDCIDEFDYDEDLFDIEDIFYWHN